MGQFASREWMEEYASREEIKEYTRSNLDLDKLAFRDLTLDNCLVQFSGIQSHTILREKCVFLFENFPAKMRDFVNQAKGLTGYPNAVGIGAFFILWMIEASLEGVGDNFSSALNSFFAREKGNEVFNIVSAYYLRFKMFVHDSPQLEEETRIYERQLGDQLTRVRSSLLGGNMSTALFKVWVNGAAFHIQMLIHLVRLKKGDRQPVEAAIEHYQRDLEKLVDEFKLLKAKSCTFSNVSWFGFPCCDIWRVDVTDRESNQQTGAFITSKQMRSLLTFSELLTEVLFELDKQIPLLKSYFSDMRQNLADLIEMNPDYMFASYE